jgi:3-phenylpropionate/trans-cinnamate dioxygenase ferredoxin subunit
MTDDPEARHAPRWTRVAELDDVKPGALIQVIVKDTQIVVAHALSGLHAFQAICPHEMANLVTGRLEATHVVCPRHLAKFDMATGAISPGWSINGLRIYPVRTIDGWIEIDEAAVERAPPFRKKTTWDLT